MRYQNLVRENTELKHEIEVLKKKNKRMLQVIDNVAESQMKWYLHGGEIEIGFDTLLQIRSDMERINELL